MKNANKSHEKQNLLPLNSGGGGGKVLALETREYGFNIGHAHLNHAHLN